MGAANGPTGMLAQDFKRSVDCVAKKPELGQRREQLPRAAVLVVFGDSLSTGYGLPLDKTWVTLLGARLKQKKIAYQVINASVSGDTSSAAVARLEHMLSVHKPAVVIVELGGNDGLRGLSLTETQRNLEKILDRLKQQRIKTLLVGIKIPPNYGPQYVSEFQKMYPALAQKRALPLVPFILKGIAATSEYMQEDGIHPNAHGQPILLENLWPYLQPLL